MHRQLLNAVAVLSGAGMLSEPLAFASAVCIGSPLLVVAYGLISCYISPFVLRFASRD